MNGNTFKFKAGTNPATGDAAIRTVVYEAIKQFPRQRLTMTELHQLLPEYTPGIIRGALRGFRINHQQYPHVHRLARGVYMFDDSRSASWVTYPSHGNKRKSRTVTISTSTPVPPTPKVAHVQAQQVLSGAVEFVARTPIFQDGKFLSMDDEVLLQDANGGFWHARRVKA